MTKPTRLRPRERAPRPWQISTYQARGAEPRPLHPTDVDLGDGLVYERRGDRIRLELAPGSELVIAPGRRFAEALAHGFTTMPELPPPSEETPCPDCGQPVLPVLTADERRVLLEPRPDASGIYLKTVEDRVRALQPMEEPTGPTYRQHVCPRGART